MVRHDLRSSVRVVNVSRGEGRSRYVFIEEVG